MSNELIIQDNNGVLARAEIDSMIATANAFPRDITLAIEKSTKLATMNEDIAASCFYSLPRKDKDGNKVEIKGKSIRLAEIMMSCWKHLHIATRVVEVAEKHISTAGICWDVENNVKVEMPDRVSIWFGEKNGKPGYRANNDMQIMLSKASCSKALRNAVFRIISPAFADIVYHAAMKKAIGDTKTLSSKIREVVEKLVKMGINQEEILTYFGHSKIDDFTADELRSLIGIGTALKEAMIKPEDVFSVEKNADTSASDALNDLLQSKQAPKLNASVDAQTGEVLRD